MKYIAVLYFANKHHKSVSRAIRFQHKPEIMKWAEEEEKKHLKKGLKCIRYQFFAEEEFENGYF